MNALIRPDMLYAWCGPSLLIVTARGECSRGFTGFYHREARHLRTWRLEVDGELPWLCEAAAVSPDTLDFAYTHPEIAEYGGGGTGQSGDTEPENARGVPQRALDLRVRYRVEPRGLTVTATVANRSRRPLQF